MTNVWDARDYDARFGFVARSGDALIDLLAPRPGQRVLDLGCGTGRHAGLLARHGVSVLGMDQDEAMLAKARSDNPALEFVQADARSFDLAALGQDEPFDACLSNAALHWMTPQEDVLGNVRAVLGPGARFVAEMGGAGNITAVDEALRTALREMGLADVSVAENFFPTIGVESGLLEAAGFRVEQMVWFPRPTPLAPGSTPADWTRHFRAVTWQQVPPELHGELAQRIDALAEAAGLRTGGGWLADYCRLRFLAVAA